MTDRKFYRTIFTVVVLSDKPLGDDCELDYLAYEITDGDCCGSVTAGKPEVLNGKQAADGLIAMASEPGFFSIDSEGNDTE